MGRRSNAAKAVSKIIKVQKQPGFFRVVIKNGDKVIFSKSRLSKDEYLTLYLKNIESNITNHPEYTIEDIIEGYKNLWSKFTIISIYTDSYGYKWKNTPLPPKWIYDRVNIIFNKIKNNDSK